MMKNTYLIALISAVVLLSSCTPMVRIPKTEPSIYIYPAPTATPNIKINRVAK